MQRIKSWGPTMEEVKLSLQAVDLTILDRCQTLVKEVHAIMGYKFHKDLKNQQAKVTVMQIIKYHKGEWVWKAMKSWDQVDPLLLARQVNRIIEERVQTMKCAFQLIHINFVKYIITSK